MGKIQGIDVPFTREHKAIEIVAKSGASLAGFVHPLQICSVLLVTVGYWRSRMSDGVRFSGAAVLAFIITGKVLSPQYLVWLFPFVVTLPGCTWNRVRWLFLSCCVLTTILYPGPGYALVYFHDLLGILILNLRNIMLLILLMMLVWVPSSERADICY